MGKRKEKIKGLHVTPVNEGELSEEARKFIESFEDKALVATVESNLRPLLTDPRVSVSKETAIRIAAQVAASYYRETRSLAKRGMQHKAATEKGGRTKKENAAELAELYRPDVKRLLIEKPKTSHHQICKEVAYTIEIDHGEQVITAETIRKNTRDLAQRYRRPGKKRGPKASRAAARNS